MVTVAGTASVPLTRRLRALRDRFRAGYPNEAPGLGYSPLMALAGPPSLTPKQAQQVVEHLVDRPADPVEVAVAIVGVTGRLPHPGQRRTIERLLRAYPGHA